MIRSRRAAPPGSDEDLVQRCLEGDRKAWDALIRTYWRHVFNVAYKFVARYEEAEDLTQDIFVKLFRSLPKWDRQATFETWLTRMSSSSTVRYSSGFSPALRTMSLPFFMCLPLQQNSISVGDALSM